MILFINGPFGVGKTSVARLLLQKMPHSRLYDPEVIGTVLHRVLGPFAKAEDFQNYTLWRPLVVGGARGLKTASARTLMIPITVWRWDLFDPIIAGLRRVDPDLSCFRLTASKGCPDRPHLIRCRGQRKPRLAHGARRGLPESLSRSSFRNGDMYGRPRTRRGCRPDSEKPDEWKGWPVEKRLEHAPIKGLAEKWLSSISATIPSRPATGLQRFRRQ